MLDWAHTPHTGLIQEARHHTQDSVSVYHANSAQPMPAGQAVRATSGDVFRFSSTQSGPVTCRSLGDILQDACSWHDDPDYIPREMHSQCWYAMHSHVTRLPLYAGSSRTELLAIAAEAFSNTVDELVFGFPDEDSDLRDLVWHGRLLRGILAAAPVPPGVPKSHMHGSFVFVDLRLCGQEPTFFFGSAGWVGFSEIVRALAVQPPPGFQVRVRGTSVEGSLILLTSACTLTLWFEPLPSETSPVQVSQAAAAGSGVPLATYGLDPGHAREDVGPPAQPEPRRYPREEGTAPEPDQALGLREPELIEVVTAGFLVCSPRFPPEHVQLEASLPCDVDDILHSLSEARQDEVSLHFDCLLPAFPQPSSQFGVVLAIPEWAAAQYCVLIDARLLDNRLFAIIVPERLNRASILLHAGVTDAPDLQVYKGVQLVDQGLSTFQHGDTISILPAGTTPPVPRALEQMLQQADSWRLPCPTHAGCTTESYLVLSDGGQRVLRAGPPDVSCAADFLRLASAAFRYRPPLVTVCPTVPRLPDLCELGQQCRALLVATEQVCKVPIPPGRSRPSQQIVFLDCRFLLKDFTWLLAENGCVDADQVAALYQPEAPFGHVVQVRGGQTEIREQGDHRRVTSGTVLTLLYVRDLPEDAVAAQSSSSGPNQDSSEASPDSDSDLSPPSPDADSSCDAQRCRSASRSPRRPPPDAAPCDQQDSLQLTVRILRHTALAGTCHSLLLPVLAHTIVVSQAREVVEPELDWHHQRNTPVCCDADLVHSSAGFGVFPGALPGFCQAKLLEEPTPSSFADSQTLAFLEYYAGQFGLPWRYQPAWRIEERLTLMPPTPSLEEVQQSLVSVAVAIAVPGYNLEHLEVQVLLPTDVATLLPLVQAQRDPSFAALFPVLVPSLPQPASHWVLFAALPAWAPQASVVLIDARRLDGRVFAIQVPVYADRKTILRLAGVMWTLPVEVHTAMDLGMLLNDHEVPFFPGQCLSVQPDEEAPPAMHVLSQMLHSRIGWLLGPAFPQADTRACYCCTIDRGHQLYAADLSRPWNHRNDIAAECGLPADSLQIQPAAPRISDCFVFGCIC